MKIIIPANTTDQWYTLIKETQQYTGIFFDDHIQNYLILTLDNFVKNESLTDEAIAVDFLKSLKESTFNSNQKLRNVGDRCLVLSGLFPEHAEKIHVDTAYFIGIGQQAYLTLADRPKIKIDPKLFYNLASRFSDISEMLNAMRLIARY